MDNGKTYLNAVDTIYNVKGEYEHMLKNGLLKKDVYELLLKIPITMHCPRGYNEDMTVNHIYYDSKECNLYYCTEDGVRMTKNDFGAEDFINMLYRIIKENF